MAEFRERDHPRGQPENAGQFAPKGGGVARSKDTFEKLKHLRRIYETVDTYDEPIPRSLSAKAKNYDIRMPNGDIAHLVEGTHITNKQIFAGAGTKTPIREVDSLVEEYGGSAEKWVKVKANATLEVQGKSFDAEIHWYEEPTVGKVRMKYKKR